MQTTENILSEAWRVARINDETATCEVETVRRGVDVPEKGYFIAKTYCYGPDEAGPIAEAIADLPAILEQLKRVIDAADRYSDTLAEIGYGNSQFGSNADAVSLSGMSKALLRKHGIIE